MANKNIVIMGASGGIGSALTEFFAKNSDNSVFAFSRSEIKNQLDNVCYGQIDFANEESIQKAAEQSGQEGPLDYVIIATGMLHDGDLIPEKSLRELSVEKFVRSFLVNTIGPALIAKYFLPKLQRKQRAVFAALSARVGSIGDNRLGGWYAYRTSKAALNMLIKTASIEVARRQKQTIVVGFHPGTVDTGLSKPFQKNVPNHKLFTADYSVKQMISVIEGLSPEDSGKLFAWDGSAIPY